MSTSHTHVISIHPHCCGTFKLKKNVNVCCFCVGINWQSLVLIREYFREFSLTLKRGSLLSGFR